MTSNDYSSSSDFSQKNSHYDYLLSLLLDLQGVIQSPRFHPEGDALYHSLQVYQCAKQGTDNPSLLAAALFHDVGKAIDYANHDQVGADVLVGVLHSGITWLVAHHLDLLKQPRRTRRNLQGSSQLKNLELLRKWDLSGRSPYAEVISPEEALTELFVSYDLIVSQ